MDEVVEKAYEEALNAALYYLPLLTHHDLARGHVELYPNKYFLPKDVIVRLKEVVMRTQADNIISETCLAPFASDEVASSTEKEHEHSVWIVSRFMGEFCELSLVETPIL
ncbi:uncharacterized protein EDB91DRAFT_1088850 [Suillus paluster]|uniref:uncharacterized protein n=1 Tax=Suillus paluster TaxID=48578 RepID=UPI001B872ACC|nr:uncharacterized protein EDB91DRAFT_1088850 [Suillus paluster]KAG1720411.1 hypothetical protein EDB91DRAFT_1088850 [Suillus paluster]